MATPIEIANYKQLIQSDYLFKRNSADQIGVSRTNSLCTQPCVGQQYNGDRHETHQCLKLQLLIFQNKGLEHDQQGEAVFSPCQMTI